MLEIFSGSPTALTNLCAPAATVIMGSIAAIYAWRTIKLNREISRNLATFEFIERAQSTVFYQEISRTFVKIKYSNEGFNNILDPQTEEHKNQRQHVVQYLNHYEILSLAIQWGALNEEICCRAFRSALISDWNAVSHIIENRQKENNRIFMEFDWLARRWAATEPQPSIIDKRRNKLSTSHFRWIDVGQQPGLLARAGGLAKRIMKAIGKGTFSVAKDAPGAGHSPT